MSHSLRLTRSSTSLQRLSLSQRFETKILMVVTTNLALATDDMLHYFKDEGVEVSTSLDGPAFLHNLNRPRPGNDSYERAIAGIERARDIVGYDNVAALMTTTSASLDHVTEIIDEYVRRDFHTIFLRPISPYGFALKTKHRTGYEMERFLDFYKRGLSYILELNRSGYRLAELYTQILLSKILTPHGTGYVDLQSPRVRHGCTCIQLQRRRVRL